MTLRIGTDQAFAFGIIQNALPYLRNMHQPIIGGINCSADPVDAKFKQHRRNNDCAENNPSFSGHTRHHITPDLELTACFA
jgi:hypothetical protein